jgi:hypothetical protein
MKPDPCKLLYGPIVRWAAHRALVGRSRCRRRPEHGRFTRREIDRLVAQAWLRFDERVADVPPTATLGNRMTKRPRNRATFSPDVEGGGGDTLQPTSSAGVPSTNTVPARTSSGIRAPSARRQRAPCPAVKSGSCWKFGRRELAQLEASSFATRSA